MVGSVQSDRTGKSHVFHLLADYGCRSTVAIARQHDSSATAVHDSPGPPKVRSSAVLRRCAGLAFSVVCALPVALVLFGVRAVELRRAARILEHAHCTPQYSPHGGPFSSTVVLTARRTGRGTPPITVKHLSTSKQVHRLAHPMLFERPCRPRRAVPIEPTLIRM